MRALVPFFAFVALALSMATMLHAGSFNDAQDGDYDVNATWGAADNPAASGVDTVTVDEHVVFVKPSGLTVGDTIYISGSGVLEVKDYEGCTVLNGSTIYLRQNGRIRLGRVTADLLCSADIIADNGKAVLEFDNGQNGNDDTRHMFATLNYGGSATGIDIVGTMGTSGIERPGVGATNAVFTKDCPITLQHRRIRLQTHRVDLASNLTLNVSGVSDWLLRTANDSSFAGTVNWSSTGLVRVMYADAMGESTWNITDGDVEIEVNNGIRGAVLNVHTGVQVRTPEWTTGGKFNGGTVRLIGARIRTRRQVDPATIGGTVILAAPGCSMQLQNQNSAVITWNKLIIETNGAALTLYSDYAGSGYITPRFADCEVRENGLFHLVSANCPIQFDNTKFTLGSSITIDGNSPATLGGIMGVRFRGNADLVLTNPVTLVSNVDVTLTDSSTWEDSTLATRTGSTAAGSAITATFNPGANKGTIDNGHGSVSFASSDLGYVTVQGLKSGGGPNARLVIIEFDAPSDLDGIQAKLETAHPGWTKFFQKGGNKIGFTLEPTIEGTGYFGWDNKHGDLGANVLSIWFGPPDRGTVVQIL